ncbi:NAD(P)-binding protein [Rhizodiscina lignyota]|uniref:NAD(P)-binding protein n=1 Tax=Rhizodiscina lignyota TaxID=1504668 RepID=A0A9P4M9B8_9PEZI|nr:NAD(P)-binding protein [Rhizodiscina lignyota]
MDVAKQLNLPDLYSANGLVAVITGGGTGIGLAFASALCQTNAKKIFILGRRLTTLQDAAKSLDPNGNVIVPIQCDVTDQESVTKAAKLVEDEVGYVDVLINNSGVTGPDHKGIYAAQNVEELQKVMLNDWGNWPTAMATNVTAVVGVSAAFLLLLDKGNVRRGFESKKLQPDGEARQRNMHIAAEDVEESDLRTSQIITISSISGFNRHVTAGMAYTGSKAAAILIGKSMATFLAPYGIRSNVICPGLYPSEIAGGQEGSFPVNSVPAGRKGNFEEMAGCILHLVGKSGAYLNGTVQITDGGRLSVFQGTF